MRVAGFVSKSERLEVDYIKSVHLVSRWVHEIFETPSEGATAGVRDVPAGIETSGVANRRR